jgi:DNA phosphorothioation-associated putative methyltransferase
MDFSTYKNLTQSITIGKHLPDAIYLHVSALSAIPDALQILLSESIQNQQLQQFEYHVVKFAKRDFKLSLLSYPGFFDEAFPVLHHSCTIDLAKGSYRLVSYLDSENSPILHRKETMLLAEHPDIPKYRALTAACEQAGLFENTKTIGFKRNWERLIKRKGFVLVEGQLVAANQTEPVSVEALVTNPSPSFRRMPESSARAIPLDSRLRGNDGMMTNASVEVKISETSEILRHKTAIRRYALSKPMQTLAQHEYLNGQYSLFDYGCGQGDDLRELQAHDVNAQGFDPVFAADNPKIASDVVNLGFVINVIENPQERAECLRDAFGLAQKLLVVSAMLGTAAMIGKFQPFGDGVLTQRNTFQKYYSQSELKAYIEKTLATNAIAVGPGIFYVFRDALDEQIFLANRFRVRKEWRQLTQPTAKISTAERQSLFEKHRALYEYLWESALDLGRCPVTQELEQAEPIKQAFGSIRKGFDSVLSCYDNEIYQQARQAKRNDLLVYFALEKFSGRKPYTHLPDSLKRDVKAFFGDYKAAQAQATELLFSAGKVEVIFEACEQAKDLGYLQDNHSLTLHTALIGNLPPVLRVYVGCATQLYGDVETADLVKIHIRSGKVSLMVYDDFEGKPLPELQERIKIKLRTQDIDFFDYVGEYQPQPLYLKSLYIPESYPCFDKQRKFDAKLLKTELFDLSGFGPKRDVFYEVLEANKLAVRGFQLIQRRK